MKIEGLGRLVGWSRTAKLILLALVALVAWTVFWNLVP
jgi:hypothetical protein